MEGAPTAYCIKIKQVHPVDENWNLCADTEADQIAWVNALVKFSYVPKIGQSEASVQSPALTRKNSVISTRPADSLSLSSSSSSLQEQGQGQRQGQGQGQGQGLVRQASASLSKKKKGGLKLASKKDLISFEWIESLCVFLIINVCVTGVMNSIDTSLTVFYVVVTNLVVLQTLSQRSNRLAVATDKTRKLEQEAEVKKAEDVKVVYDSKAAQNDNDDDGIPPAQGDGDGKPTPGGSFKELVGEVASASNSQASFEEHTWCKVDPKIFQIRGKDYMSNKKKVPSMGSIYEPFAMDVFCSKNRIDHAATRFELPDTSDINTHSKFVPPIFIIQLQIPSEPPTSLFSAAEDGPGWAIVMYYRITAETCRQLQDLSTASESVKVRDNCWM